MSENQNGQSAPEPSLQDLMRELAALRQMLFDPRSSRTVAEIIDLYLKDVPDQGLVPKALVEKGRHLKRFALDHGTRAVKDCDPMMLKTWIKDHKTWGPATCRAINVVVQRAFNWAVGMRIIQVNPFKGIRFMHGPTRQAMTDQDFRTLLRNSNPFFRRLVYAMYLTGARTGEIIGLRWNQIDWERSIAVLQHHKTEKTTGKPRVIVLVPVMIRLLRWIKKYRYGRAAALMQRILENGPVPVNEVVRRMKAAGFYFRSIYRARIALGVHYDGCGPRVYQLPPAGAKPPHDPKVAEAVRKILADGPVLALEVVRRVQALGFSRREMYRACEAIGVDWRMNAKHKVFMKLDPDRPRGDDDFVFLNMWGDPWTGSAISNQFRRLRRIIDISKEAVLYQLRHKFGTDAVRNGVALILVAKLMGHGSVATTERNYVHIDTDYRLLLDAAQQIHQAVSNPKKEPAGPR